MSQAFHVNINSDPNHVVLPTTVARLGEYGGLSTKAEAHDIGRCSLIFDDPDGTLTPVLIPWHQFRVEENDCAAVGADGVNGKLVWIGAIQERTYRRGTGPRISLITGAEREIEVALADVNGYTSGRIFKGTDGVRPAETDIARITWLMSSGYFPVSDDAGYFDTSGPVNMDATDYLNQTPTDVLHDCALASGKNHFTIPWEATGNATLWYANSDTSTNYSSLLRISNVLTDVDNTTTFAPAAPDAVLLRDPTRVFSTVQVQCPAGAFSAYNATTASTFGSRDGSSVTSNVTSSAAATALAARLLADASTEEDRVTCSVQLPSTLATGIKVGQRIQCRFSHLPGYEDFTWLRVNSLQIAQDEQTDQRYTLQLEMTPQRLVTAPGHALLAWIVVNNGPCAPATDYSTNGWSKAYVSGNFAYPVQTVACGAGPPSNEEVELWYRPVVVGEAANVLAFIGNGYGYAAWVFEVEGVDLDGLSAVSGLATVAEGATIPVSASAGATPSTLFGGVCFAKVGYDGGWGWPGGGYGYEVVTGTAGTELVNASEANGPEGNAPWSWIAHTEGTGTLTLSAVADTHGAGGGYACGYMVAKAAVLIPTVGSFSIVQSAFGGAGSGATCTVTLSSPPG